MKELVALLLVLGMSSLASADLVVTVNGEPQPDAITLMTSETIELDLDLSAGGYNVWHYAIDWTLSNDQAELIPDKIAFPTAFDFPGSYYGGGQQVKIDAANFISPAVEGPAVLMQGLILHCLEETDVVLTVTALQPGSMSLWGGWPLGELVPIEFVHTLRIIQIPEPATIALLGLGGLAVLRKRRR